MSSSEQMPGNSGISHRISESPSHASLSMGQFSGETGLRSTASSIRTTPYAVTTGSTEGLLDIRLAPRQTPPNSSVPDSTQVPPLVDRSVSPTLRKVSATTVTIGNTLHRCQSVRLGSTPPGTPNGRSLDVGTNEPSYQCSRTLSSLSRSPPVQEACPEPDYTDHVRQLNCTELPTQPRRNKESDPDKHNLPVFPTSGLTEHDVPVSSHSRSPEHSGRSDISPRPGHLHRMDSKGRNLGLAMDPVAPSNDRCLRNMSDTSSTPLLLSSARPSSRSSRRHVSKLGNSQSLSFPPVSTTSSSFTKTLKTTTQLDSTHHSVEPDSSLVSLAVGTKSKRRLPKTSASSRRRPAQPAPMRRVHATSGDAESSRMLAASMALQLKGVSARTAQIALRDTTDSARRVYDCEWNNFTKWCNKQEPKIDPIHISVSQFADFIGYLGEDCQFAISTIRNYRTAVASVLKHYNRKHITSDGLITSMINAFKRSTMKPKNRVPKWNLALVINHLTKTPFEPIDESPIKHLTQKTIFLVLLGTGCRRSELHAIDRSRLEHHKRWKWVNLLPLPEFRAKFQAKDPDPTRSWDYTLRRLSNTADPEELVSCPIRALHAYL